MFQIDNPLKCFSYYGKILLFLIQRRNPIVPLWIEYIDFFIGIIGFFLTIVTLLTARNVKQRIIHNAEYEQFRKNIDDITGKLEGFINSIAVNKIYEKDKHFKYAISQFLTDIKTTYTFLSKKNLHIIQHLQNDLQIQDLSFNDWNNIVDKLISLKNALKKEDIYHE